ncbi:hypothetical protein Daus18300_009756 [Diaporthe australafricana]|uniref:Protein kinase domain-containing protein n=1 Tax=Diaporthe australafricana TaxID=127596 RepID=A0ABR3WCY7_9PEZI
MSAAFTKPPRLDLSVIDDINDRIFPDIQDFYGKFFANRPWTPMAEEFVQALPQSQKRIDSHVPGHFVNWLMGLEASLAERAEPHCSWCEHNSEESHSSDQILVLSDIPKLETGVNWADVAVLGLFFQGNRWEGILQLCGYAKSVFSSQPSRAFLHGFLVRGQEAELWLFDRSGIYGSSRLTVTDADDSFLSAITGYMFMDRDEWGMSPLVHRDGEDEYVSLPCEHDTETPTNTYILGPKIFERVSGHMVGDGLTVYRARRGGSPDWSYAIKFKWSESSEDDELEMLKLLKERNVWGVIRLHAYYVGANTEMLHDGLTLGNPITLQADSDGSRFEIDEPATGSSVHDIQNEHKSFTCTVVAPEGRSLHKYKSILEILYALRDAAKAHRSLYLDGQILHRDINPSNIIIPSYDPTRDAADASRGILIDFDMSKENSEPYQPNQAVGTYIFQAIGVLRACLPDNPHTYRHDLESFFYTFLFLAVAPRPVPKGENQLQLPATSVLREWNKGRPFDKANRKIQDMESVDEFRRRIVAEFTPEFQGLGALAEKLRGILFPVDGDGEIWTGTDMTDHGTNALYDAVIGAFEDAALESARL